MMSGLAGSGNASSGDCLGAGFLKLTADREACRSSGRYSTISPASGLIAQYNAATPMPGPDMFSVLHKRPTLRGFIVWDFAAKQDDHIVTTRYSSSMLTGNVSAT